jgi:hypothetical protein
MGGWLLLLQVVLLVGAILWVHRIRRTLVQGRSAPFPEEWEVALNAACRRLDERIARAEAVLAELRSLQAKRRSGRRLQDPAAAAVRAAVDARRRVRSSSTSMGP